MVVGETITGNDLADFGEDDFEYFEIDESARAVLKDAVDEAIATYAKSQKTGKADAVEFKRLNADHHQRPQLKHCQTF